MVSHAEKLVATLTHGWPVREAQAALGLVLGFGTWGALTVSGLEDAGAARLAGCAMGPVYRSLVVTRAVLNPLTRPRSGLLRRWSK